MCFPSSLICQWRMTVHYRPQGTCSSRCNEHTAGGHSFHVVSRLPATETKSTALYMGERSDSVLTIIMYSSFYALFLQIGAHSSLQSKEKLLQELTHTHTHTHTPTHSHTHTLTHTHTHTHTHSFMRTA